jgi:hypothetical protein
MPTSTEPRRGALGLHLPDLAGAAELLGEAPECWPQWTLVRTHGEGQPSEFVEDGRARVRSEPSGWVDVDFHRRTSRLALPHRPGDREIVHPYLGSTAVLVAYWQRRPSFHAGAFVAHGRAWAILGDKGAGKSSLLACLALAEVPILTDDVLVIADGGRGLAGPRCIDLRAESARALGVGEPLGVVGTRERWRVQTGPVQPEVPMGGWIRLGWGEPGIDPVPASERVAALFSSFSLGVQPRDPLALDNLMELVALPMLRVRQPRDIAQVGRTADRLLSYLGELP